MVFDQNQDQIMEGRRSSNNCYLLTRTSIRTRETWLRQFLHTSNNIPQNTSSGHLSPGYVYMETGPGKTNKLNGPAYTMFPLSKEISKLGILPLDHIGIMDN